MITLIINGIAGGGPVNPYAQSYQIAIDHTQCGSTDRTNYTDYVFMSNTNLKTVANGGLIQNTVTVNGQVIPADLVFSSDNLGATLLSWEIEYYDGVNGILYAHVKLPTVSHTTNTAYYVSYGLASVSTYQGGAVGAAWDTQYAGVWHMANGTTLSGNDSTANGNNSSSINNVTATAGQIDGAGNFNYAGSGVVNVPSSASLQITGDITVSCWIKPNTAGSTQLPMEKSSDTGGFANVSYGFGWGGGGNIGFIHNNSLVATSGYAPTTSWQYLVMVRNVGMTSISYYVNGVSKGTFSYGANTPSANTSALGIGNRGAAQATTIGLDGLMDEVRIVNIQRTSDDQLTEYNNQISPGNIGSPAFHIFT